MGLGDDGGGGPRGGRPRPHARGRARSAPRRHRRRDLPPGLRRGGEHHALVLPPPPLRPAAPAPLRPPLARRRGRATGPTTGPWPTWWRRGRARATPSSCRTTTSRCSGGCWPRRARTCARCTSCTRPSPRPTCSGCCPTTCGRSCSTAWRATRPAASTATSGRPRSWPVTPRPDEMGAGAGSGDVAPPTFVAPLGPDAGLLEEEAAAPDCVAAAAALRDEVGGRRIIARTDRMEPSKNIVRGMLAFEELLTAYPEWRGRGGARGVGLSQPAGAGRVSRLRGRCGAHGGAHQPCLRDRRVDAHCAVARGRPGPLARRADAVRRAAGQPGARRAQPRRQGGAAAQHGRRCARPVPPGRGVGGARTGRWRRTRGQPLRCGGHGRRAAPRTDHGRARRVRHGPAALRAAVRGRTAADWWADQLAAAQR